MERIKVPFGWHVWGWFTLLASLGVHGFLLSLPMSFSLDAPEPEPEPIAAVPLTTLPEIASPPESEMVAAEPEAESIFAEDEIYKSESISAADETYELESEYITADTLSYEPEPEVATPRFATTVDQRRREEESTRSQQPAITSSDKNSPNFEKKKRRLNNSPPNGKGNLNPNPEESSDVAGEVDENLKDAVKNIDEEIQEYLARLDDEHGAGSLLKEIDDIYFYLGSSPGLTEHFFEGASSNLSLGNLKPGVIEITFIVNPEKKDKAIEVNTLYDEFIQPYLARKGFQIEILPNHGELQFYQAQKDGLIRHVMLAPIPKNRDASDSSETSEIFGTFIVLYNPEVLNIGL